VTEINPLRILKNAGANVARGGTSALVALALPPLLTRSMSAEAYGTWTLVLQLSAYIGYLDFGIQTAVGRFVAFGRERNDRDYCNRMVSTAIMVLGVAALLGLIAAVGIAFILPRLFHQMPSSLLSQARVAIFLVAGSLAIGLPFSAFNGVFVGMHRYEIPAFTIGGSRLLSAGLLVLIVHRGGGLLWMGAATACVNLISYALQFAVYRKLAADVTPELTAVAGESLRELVDYCLSFSLWTYASLLVAGVDLILVGFFQYQEVPYYAVAATLVMFLAGLQSATFNALLSPAAALHARGNASELGRMLVTSTRYGTFLLLLTGVPLLLWADPILTLWVGPTYASHAALYLRILVVANMIRLAATPYSVLLLGTAQHRLALGSPVAEGFTNLIASIVGGYWFGARGVAVGTLIGAVVGVSIHLVRNIRRTSEIRISKREFLRDGVVVPLTCSIPLVAGAASLPLISFTPVAVLTPALLLSALLAWKCGMPRSEREWVKSLMLRGVR
jgi:O-antigen/teichoic acid export membrane protein